MTADEPAEEAHSQRREDTAKLWADVRIDPIKIALPAGVGYTLRAYRSSTEIAAQAGGRATVAGLDEFDAAAAAVARRRREAGAGEDEGTSREVASEGVNGVGAGEHVEEEDLEEEDVKEEDLEEEDLEEEELQEEELEEEQEQEIPVFLGLSGRVYLFRSPERLAEFVRTAPQQDLAQLDTWSDLVKRIRADDVAPLDEDTYELDLVVENLRGGPDAWEPSLILKAGELARDLAYALRVDSILVALAPGSPLDDLDEALRAAEAGGVGRFFAKRRLRKIPAQQSSLAWRTIIGKISGLAEWRD